MIEEWLNREVPVPQANTPLVIEAEGGVGKKTLLVKWFEYHQSLKEGRNSDLIILNFATTGGNNSNYFYAIYRILIKLRQELNIRQKVELHEEKLRKYFNYWLDVCNQRLQNQAIQSSETIYQKIILVFEGIDYFVDRSTNKEGNLSFWLPKYFPKNVKVIVTADRQSESMRYFESLNCSRVSIPANDSIVHTMIKWQSQKLLCVEGSTKKNLIEVLETNIKKAQVTSLYVKAFLSCLLPEKLTDMPLNEKSLSELQERISSISLEKLLKLHTVAQLFQYMLQFWSQCLFGSSIKFQELVGLLISTQKGLTLSQIMLITKIEHEELKLFITVFRVCLMNFKNLWMIKNDNFKKSIHKIFAFNSTHLNQKIAQALKKTPNSVRKLEQQTFQLYSAGNYFKLKEVISDIQNFLLLFNPYTKYDLCRYWQKLQERSFDPVIEYNKAIEGFQTHYHPSPDDLFRIITQISRFLREFSDFQTYYTPEFRHPKLIGAQKELDDLGILGQFRNLCLCQEENAPAEQERLQEEQIQTDFNQSQQKLKKKLKEMLNRIQQGKQAKNQPSQTKGNPQILPEKKKLKPTRIQQVNVEVKANQQAFRHFYYQQVKPFLIKVGLQGKQQQISHINQNDSDYQQEDKQAKTQSIVSKIKIIQSQRERVKANPYPNLKQLYATTIAEDFELNQKPTTNYYYKRWIWMQFPWVSMSLKCDYSEKLRKCFMSPTSYMSVSQQRQFTLQALKIALDAKKKKQAILEQAQSRHATQLRQNKQTRSSEKCTPSSIQQNAGTVKSRFKQGGSADKRKFTEMAFITNSFLSLSKLSKEMDGIKHDIGGTEEDPSVFITAQQKNTIPNSDYSSILHGLKKKKRIIGDEAVDQSLNKSHQGLLPRIKQSVNSEIARQLSELEQNNAQIRKQVDSYLYKNRILAKRLKQLKIIQINNLGKAKSQKKLEEKKRKVAEIQDKIQRVKINYAYSLLENERLEVLIKICRLNKTCNEQTISDLTVQCNNFKKMIRLQTDTIASLKKKTEEIKKLTKKFVANTCQRIQNEEQLNQQLQNTYKNRKHFQNQIQRYDQMIVEEIQSKRRELSEQMNASILAKDDPHVNTAKKALASPLEEEDYQNIYQQINSLIPLENQTYYNHPLFTKLLASMIKRRQFQAVIAQKNLKLHKLRSQYEQSKRELEIIQSAKEEMNDLISPSDDEEDYEPDPRIFDSLMQLKKQLLLKRRQLSRFTELRLSCIGLVNQLYINLGLSEHAKLQITPEFLKRVKDLIKSRDQSKIVLF